MATNQTVYRTKSTSLPLEEVQNFPPRLATGFQIYHTLKVLEEEREAMTPEQYELAVEAVCELIYAVTEPLEA